MTANFTIHFGTAIDTQGLMTGVQNIMQTISKAPPITVGTQVRNVDTGDAERVLTSIKSQATALNDVVVKQITYRNAVGETYTAITQMTTKYKTATGEMKTQTDQISSGVKNLGTGWTKVQEVLVRAPIGKQIAEFETYYKKQEQAFDKMAARGAEWSTRAERMGQKEKQAIQESVNLLNQKINLYKQAVSSGNIIGADRLASAVQAQNIVVEENIAKSKRAANAVRSWADNIKNAIVQTLSYTVSLGSLRAAQQLLNEAIKFSIELNKEMVKIQLLQVEGAQTDDEITSLAGAYNDLAQELGATTLEVAKGSVEWLRQGKTIEETTELLKASTMLSKLGNMEAAESTEYLTSAVNGYGLASSEAASIVDKLIAVDNVAATSAKELATALRYSSAVASQAGVPLEKLISYIGVISSTTRQNAEMIGQALKTIFTRMQDIKQGGLDEDGLGINNVERALRRVDIKLRDSQTEFRNMSDVLEDLAAKWNTLNEVEQANIGKAMAGVRQQNMFMILMTNMNKALELQEVQYNANGLAVDRYGIYLKSVEASQNRLKASTEAFFLTFNDLDNIIIGINNLGSGILNLITDMGGLRTIVMAVTVAVLYLKRAWIADNWLSLISKQSITGVINSFKLLLQLLAMSPNVSGAASAGFKQLGASITTALGISGAGFILVLLSLTAALVSFAMTIDTPLERLDKLTKKTKELKDEMSGLSIRARDIRKISGEYELLRDKAKSVELTADETERLINVQNQLKEQMPNVIGEYDEYGNFIISTTQSMEDLNKETLEQIENQKALIEAEFARKASSAGKNLGQMFFETQNPFKVGAAGLKESDEESLKQAKEYQAKLSELKSLFAQSGLEAQNEFIKGLSKWQGTDELVEFFKQFQIELEKQNIAEEYVKHLGRQAEAYYKANPIKGLKFEISQEGILSFVQEIQDKIKKFSDIQEKMDAGDVTGISTEELNVLGLEIENIGGKWQFTAKSLEEFNSDLNDEIQAVRELNPELAIQLEAMRAQNEVIKDAKESLNSLLSAQEMLSSAIKEQNDNDRISINTAMRLIDAGYASALVFNQETGAIYLDISAMQAANLAKAQLALTTAQAAWAAVGHATALNAEEQALYGTYKAALAVVSALTALGGMPITTVAPSIGGGGGGGGESAEKKAIEEKIKALENEKDALQDRLDAFNDYIDAQKESLKLAKEEADFNKEQSKKNKDLADIRTEIAMLALDDSQEARNKRLELEDEAAKLEEEITQDSEDRKYDLQIDALDAAQEAFEKVIKIQIDAIDESIEGYREQASAIKSASGGVGGLTSATMTYKQIAKDTYDAIMVSLEKQKSLTIAQKGYIRDVITKMLEQGSTADELIAKWEHLMSLIGNWGSTSPNGVWQGADVGSGTIGMHTGGTVETHHDGNFAGNLNSNEVFAKLLKGEYIATEVQMNNFMKNVLPNIAGRMAIENQNSKVLTGDTNIKVEINIAGSVDKKIIPKIEESALKGMNKALRDRGIKRLAGSFSI